MEEEKQITKSSSAFSPNVWAVIALVGFFGFVVGDRWQDIAAGAGSLAPNSANSELPKDLNYEEVERLYDVLRINYEGELSEEALINGLKEGLAKATGDPYTVYLSAEQAQEFTDDLNGTFTGIGAELGINDEGQLIIVSPLDGFPAQTAGLRPQDVIVAIDGEDALSSTIEEAVTKIRGEAGTEVTLTIFRNNETLDITITREAIVVPSVKTELLEDGTVGYLKISRFAEDTARLSREAADSFVEAGVESVILDLRNDGGGFLESAIDVSSLWLEDKLIVEQRRGDEVIEALESRNDAPLAGIKTVVLINQGSASASEIVAGALQDHKAATIIGEQSFGKGSVQSLEQLGDGGILKVTIARWYTPLGRNIDEDGIAPDVEIALSEEDIQAERDSQRDRAIQELKKP